MSDPYTADQDSITWKVRMMFGVSLGMPVTARPEVAAARARLRQECATVRRHHRMDRFWWRALAMVVWMELRVAWLEQTEVPVVVGYANPRMHSVLTGITS